MTPERDQQPIRPELHRDPLQPARAPAIQRLAPREPETPPVAARPAIVQPARPQPPAPGKDAHPKPGFNLFGRAGKWAAILLLLVAGGTLIGGSDEKQTAPLAPTAYMNESIPDEIVVDLKDSATDAQIAALQQSLGISLRYNSINSMASKLMVARVPPGDRDRVLASLKANPLVEAAEPEFVYHIDQVAAPAAPAPATGKTYVPNDPDYPQQWHLKMIGMEEAWARTKGKGATVAVIDTGMGAMSQTGLIEPQDFNQTQFVKGFNFTNNQELAPDDIGHGTHVTGTIAESTGNGLMGAGVAPEAAIMPLRVSDARGQATLAAVADAIRYASDHGANVVNMSISGANYSQIMEKAIQDGYKKDVTFVCAAGNTGVEGVQFPAKYKECIAVSAVGPGNLFAYYSTFGKEVDLAGPGGNPRQGEAGLVWQDSFMQRRGPFGSYGPRVDGLFALGGTSSAAPHVAGVAALLVSLGMKDPKEIRSQLRKSANKYAPADHYGAGVLDAAAAVRTVQRSNRVKWIQVAVLAGAAALLFTIGSALQKPGDPHYFVHRIAIALAAGMFLPIAIEKLVGFGSLWNLVGHSVILAVLLLSTPTLDRSGFWQALVFTAGLMLHLLLDVDSGRAPFQVLPQQRILFWLYANVAVGLYFSASAYRASRRTAAPELSA